MPATNKPEVGKPLFASSVLWLWGGKRALYNCEFRWKHPRVVGIVQRKHWVFVWIGVFRVAYQGHAKQAATNGAVFLLGHHLVEGRGSVNSANCADE